MASGPGGPGGQGGLPPGRGGLRTGCRQGERKWLLLPKPPVMFSKGNSFMSHSPETPSRPAPLVSDGSLSLATGRATSPRPPRLGKRVFTSQASAAVILPTSGLAVQ